MIPNTEICYSRRLPKPGKKLINSINLINAEVFNFCLENQAMNFIGHNTFSVNGDINLTTAQCSLFTPPENIRKPMVF